MSWGGLAIAIWAFARAYYFAFYVVEHCIDPGHKYAGLLSFLKYMVAASKWLSQPPVCGHYVRPQRAPKKKRGQTLGHGRILPD